MKTFCLCLVLAAGALAAEPVSSKKPATKPAATAAKTDDQATVNKKREAKRADLLSTITQMDQIISRYEKQSAFTPGPKVTQAAYDSAKAKRDKAQAERDALAN